MQRKTRFKIALLLALPLCLALAWVGHAAWTDPVTKLEIAKYVKNALYGVSIPQWQIFQYPTKETKSILWEVSTLNPRFAIYENNTPTDMTDDIVLDRETGLVWTRDANIEGTTWDGLDWGTAMFFARGSAFANRMGWRLPTIEELSSLVDPTLSNPALPAGRPFIDVQVADGDYYWSSTTSEVDSDKAYGVRMDNGMRVVERKIYLGHHLFVRGGNGYATGGW
jgi:hypothetical protein